MEFMRTVDDGVECRFCDVRFTYMGSLAMHLNMKHLTTGIEKCDACDVEVQGTIALREHKEKQHKIPYKCKDCEYTTYNKKKLKKHSKLHSEDPSAEEVIQMKHEKMKKHRSFKHKTIVNNNNKSKNDGKDEITIEGEPESVALEDLDFDELDIEIEEDDNTLDVKKEDVQKKNSVTYTAKDKPVKKKMTRKAKKKMKKKLNNMKHVLQTQNPGLKLHPGLKISAGA